MPTAPVSVRIDESIKSDLLEICEKTGRSQSQHIEHAIADHVKREKEFISMVQQGQNSNQFAEHDEVDNWLASWATDNELDPPRPRSTRPRSK